MRQPAPLSMLNFFSTRIENDGDLGHYLDLREKRYQRERRRRNTRYSPACVGILHVRTKNAIAWTRAHGHLVIMGGIVLIETADAETAKRVPTILTPEILEDLMKDPGFEIAVTGKR